MTSTQELCVKLIGSEEEALKISSIRNECASFMTHDASIINDSQQLKWYRESYLGMAASGEMMVYLIVLPNTNQDIGFGVVRAKDSQYWLTGGLREKYRGKGYGKALFKSLIKMVPSNEVWLDVLKTNSVGQHIYHQLGFTDVSKEKNEHGQDIVIMQLKKS